MRPLRFFAALLCSLTAALPAQTTHNVTGQNLQAAIKSAKAGDILLVTGWVTDHIVIDKPLFIYGRKAGFWALGSVRIQSIPKGSALTFGGFLNPPKLTVSGCKGHVLLANIQGAAPLISSCEDVAIADCDLTSTSITSSRVTISQSKIRGYSYSTRFPQFPGTHGLTVTDSSVSIWDTTIRGGRDGSADLSAIRLIRSNLWLHRSQLENVKVWGRIATVTGTGSMLYDPSVVFDIVPGAPPIESTIKTTRRPLPLFTMPQTPIGGRATASFHATAGTTYGMFVGFPGTAIAIPGITGTFDLTQPVLLKVGKLPASGVATLSFTVPNVAPLRGQMFRWQGITVRGSAAEWSNSVMESHY